ncbi:MAG TPA: hypothetical protein VFB89_01450 [Gemmatimonadales bacterium]|nr:hypothetical protein [Gemmatimonadales bacterium]
MPKRAARCSDFVIRYYLADHKRRIAVARVDGRLEGSVHIRV